MGDNTAPPCQLGVDMGWHGELRRKPCCGQKHGPVSGRGQWGEGSRDVADDAWRVAPERHDNVTGAAPRCRSRGWWALLGGSSVRPGVLGNRLRAGAGVPLCWEPAVAAPGPGGSSFRDVSGRGANAAGGRNRGRHCLPAALSSPATGFCFPSSGFFSPAFVRSGCQEDKSLGPALALPQPEELEAVTAGAAAGGAAFHWGSALGLPRRGRGAAVSPSQSRAWTEAPIFQLPSAAAGGEAHPGAGPGARARGGERREPPAGRTCPQGPLRAQRGKDPAISTANMRLI
ncbi:uncharacterized protein [Patagioenas fasciata]|uniref:uncharacterized protein n=1 Tax=Patagioenas fasciata TaxID=372321 RepID=UPI003A98FFB4